MGEIPIPVTEAQIYGHPISPHLSYHAQTLRDQSDVSCVARISSNDQAKEYSLSKQRENYDLAHEYLLEQSYHRMGERRHEHRQGQLVDLVV